MTELEQRFAAGVQGFRRWLDEHSRLVIGSTTLLLALQWGGVIDIGLPDWWPLAAAVVIAAGIAAYFGADKVAELIPEEDGILLVAFRADDDGGGEIWELQDDTFADMETDGTLFEWTESSRRVYEVRNYDPEENTAIANWRETAPGSTLAQERTVEDVFTAIRELREDLEPSAAEARELRRRIRGIVRRLDEERTKARARQLDEQTLDKGLDATTISEVIDEQIPDDLHPDAGRGSDDEPKADAPRENGHADDHEIDIEVNDDMPLQGL
ncbi:hypothetical protein [Halovenus marina]|uniref:hypothetical protein n=1 Tax=Halovenus marina TaxID=3396621 RepID=UPI003F57D3D8